MRFLCGPRGALPALILVFATGCASPPAGGSGTPAASVPASADFPHSTPTANDSTPTPSKNAQLIPATPTGPVIDGTPVDAADADAEFRLAIHADQDRYRAGQLIDVSATLSYLGPNAGIVVGGSGTGLVGFTLERDEPAVRIDAAGTSDCRPYQMLRGIAAEHPLMKTGGFADEDPLAAFYRAYFASPELRLPAGTWTISAVANFLGSADCDGPEHGLNASVRVVVEP
jgi:hypothetical protein